MSDELTVVIPIQWRLTADGEYHPLRTRDVRHGWVELVLHDDGSVTWREVEHGD